MQRATNWIMMVSYFHACVLCRPDIQAHSVWLAISMPLSLARPMLPLCMHCHSACDPEPHRMRCTHTHTHTQLIQFQLIAILRIRRATCGLWRVRTRDVRGVHDNHYNGHCCASSPQKHHAARAYGERCWHCFWLRCIVAARGRGAVRWLSMIRHIWRGMCACRMQQHYCNHSEGVFSLFGNA